MREKRLDIATNTNYATGPTTGQPTKIAPPAVNTTDGKIPGQAFGAQWQNYVEHYLQRQIEVSAIVPFRNWIELPLSSIIVPAQSRLAFNKYAGLTMMVRGGGANNSWYYMQELLEPSAAAPQPYNVTPAAGNFVAKGVAAVEDPTSPSWLVVGTNTTAPTKTIWKVVSFGAATEVTSPVSGSVELICRDATTGYFYAFAADTNRSVLVHGPATSDTWSVLGQRGAGAPAPSSTNMQVAAANGLLLLAYTVTPGSTQATVERISTGAFSRTVLTPFSDTSTVLDVIYSPQMGNFMLLTRDHTFRFADPNSGVEPFSNDHPYETAIGFVSAGVGCLHSTGPVYTDAHMLVVNPWLGDPPQRAMFGSTANIPSVDNLLRYDGSAIWFIRSLGGTPRVFRTLRSN